MIRFLSVLSVLFVLILSQVAYGQNLVSNYSLEIWNGTQGSSSGQTAYIGVDDWYVANATPEYHNVAWDCCNLDGIDTTCVSTTGSNWCGYACHEDACIGIYTGFGPTGTKEWAGNTLSANMVDGETYKVSFWITNQQNKPAYKMATNQWGIFFSEDAMPAFDPSNVDFDLYTDHFVTCDQIIESDNNEWEKVEWCYTANGNYSNIFIGYVGNQNDGLTDNYTATPLGLGYKVWIDKIEIVPASDGTLDLVEDITICEDSSATLTVSTDLPFTWDNGSSDSIRVVWPTETTTYGLEIEDSTSCITTDSVTVFVENCTCIIDFNVGVNKQDVTTCYDDPNCNGSGTATPLNGTAPFSYSWNDDANQSTNIAISLCSGSYSCIIEDFMGCLDTVSITVDSLSHPSLTYVAGEETCFGSEDGSLVANATGGESPYSYNWSNNVLGASNMNITSGNYTLEVLDVYGCSFTTTAVVGQGPITPPLLLDTVMEICEGGGNLSLNFTFDPGGWTGAGIINGSGIFNPNIVIADTNFVEYSFDEGCFAGYILPIYVKTVPSLSFTGDPLMGCSPLEVTLEATSNNADYISWYIGGQLLSSSSSIVSTEISESGIYDVSAIIEGDNGCVNEYEIDSMIHVYSNPEADFIFTPLQTNDNEPEFTFENLSEGATSFLWDFADGATSDEVNPSHAYQAYGIYPVLLTVFSENGCSDTRLINAEHQQEIVFYIPNSFTPNEDGINDLFKVVTLQDLAGFRFSVYNRWGERIFYTEDINQGWNGSVNGGSYYVPDGMYTYELGYSVSKYDLHKVEVVKHKGTINIVR